MADATIAHHPEAFEPPLLGAYSKKLGMWLFLLSDSLTFGALLFAYTYGRISTPNWPTPFDSHSIINATVMTGFLLTSSLTMVLAVAASRRGDAKWTQLWLLATMLCGTVFVVLHAMEWNTLRVVDGFWFNSGPAGVPQFGGTFFSLTGMHMLHVTVGVIYLGVVAFRKKFLPALLAAWFLCWLAIPADNPFHAGSYLLLPAAVIAGLVLFFKPKVYDAHDVEVSGLYWHFVDLVWMFIFPLVYLMSTKIQ